MQYGKDNLVDEIKSRCNIVDVIGSVVELKRAGNNYKGRCPFHNEKTPSFVVSENKQIFTCFGCNATGDVIEFVKKYYNLEFREALEKLGNQCGIEVKEHYGNSDKKNIYYDINKEAATFYFKCLREKDNPGIRYVMDRGLSKDVLYTFGIGYADGNWTSLYKYLKSKGYKEDDLLKLGLISYSKGRYYDKFRNRVIFPIQNPTGKVIGFGGRAIGDDMPKYLNSMETPVFSKKNNLYGFNITKNHINKMDQVILVEGYMDVIALYQGGVFNTSASLGTALTENQCDLIKRYTKNVILSYDADDAGKNAALRGSKILHDKGMKVRILHITDGKDPDDYIRAKGKLAFYNLVKNATPFFDYRLNLVKAKYNLRDSEDRVDFIKEIIVILKTFSPVEADSYIKRVSEVTNISEAAIKAEMNNTTNEVKTVEKKADVAKEIIHISTLEKNLIKIILTESKYYEKIRLYSIFESDIGYQIYKGIETLYIPGNEIDITSLCDLLDTDVAKELQSILDGIKLAGNINNIYDDCIKTYMEETLATKEKELIMRLSLAEDENDIEVINEITSELVKIQKERKSRG